MLADLSGLGGVVGCLLTSLAGDDQQHQLATLSAD